MRLKFYRVEKPYTDLLRTIDPHVTNNNSSHLNTYIGIIFEMNEVTYFAPMTHTTLDNKWHQVPVKIINNDGDVVNELGTILLHNMIPVYEEVYEEVDVEQLQTTDIKRYDLYQEQLNWMNIVKNKETILSKAEEIYKVHNSKNHKQKHYLNNILNCKLNELTQGMIEYKMIQANSKLQKLTTSLI